MPHGFRSTFRDLACRLSRNMLHAVLHGKLDESLPEPDRLEDALTSTVFGALVWTGSWDLLARWLHVGVAGDDDKTTAGIRDCWFWPRMAFAEPDVLLRLDGALVVVEAKYRSDRHDVAVDVTGDPDRGDQLVRQFRSIITPSEKRSQYAESIEQAIRQCQPVQVFLVDARRQRRAHREWEESKRRLSREATFLSREATLHFVTWQDLFYLLREPSGSLRWAADLRGYLEHLDLDTFEGVSRPRVSADDKRSVERWRTHQRLPSLRKTMSPVLDGAPEVLVRWRVPARNATSFGLRAAVLRVVGGNASRSILAWRRPGDSRRADGSESKPNADDMRSVERWRTYQRLPSLRKTMSPVLDGAPEVLVRWRVPARNATAFGLRAAVLRVVGRNASRSILVWRRSGDSRRADGSESKPQRGKARTVAYE